jgi:nucleotide-binding universal stress UspA family protein
MSSRARRILVAFDDSDASRRALDAAADLMGYGSSLSVVHVRRADVPVDRTGDVAREQLLRRRILGRYLEPSGHAAREIVNTACAIGADLVVVGRRNAVEDTLGTVSSEIVRDAPCDVLVVN